MFLHHWQITGTGKHVFLNVLSDSYNTPMLVHATGDPRVFRCFLKGVLNTKTIPLQGIPNYRSVQSQMLPNSRNVLK